MCCIDLHLGKLLTGLGNEISLIVTCPHFPIIASPPHPWAILLSFRDVGLLEYPGGSCHLMFIFSAIKWYHSKNPFSISSQKLRQWDSNPQDLTNTCFHDEFESLIPLLGTHTSSTLSNLITTFLHICLRQETSSLSWRPPRGRKSCSLNCSALHFNLCLTVLDLTYGLSSQLTFILNTV